MKIPEFLSKAITDNSTSLGDHPAFPPEDDDTFVSSIIRSMYSKVMEGVETDDRKELFAKIDDLVIECQKEEESCKEALEKLCSDTIATMFHIPDDTINMEGKLVTECDMSKYRMIPDSTPDFEFEDIDEMKLFSEIIYQRRMIDCLMSGISEYYSTDINSYIQELYKINPRLPNLYAEIKKYNTALLYNQPDSIKSIEKSKSGCVDVSVGEKGEKITVKAEGTIFPVLLEYSIRGILEIASMKGLPEEQEKMEYILGKTDYRLAENWDLRLGIPLWHIFMECAANCGYDVSEIEPNFIIMELSKLESETFNTFLQNVFKNTKKGKSMMSEFLGAIQYNKDLDNFDNFVDTQNSKYSINDNVEEYTSEELLSESLMEDKVTYLMTGTKFYDIVLDKPVTNAPYFSDNVMVLPYYIEDCLDLASEYDGEYSYHYNIIFPKKPVRDISIEDYAKRLIYIKGTPEDLLNGKKCVVSLPLCKFIKPEGYKGWCDYNNDIDGLDIKHVHLNKNDVIHILKRTPHLNYVVVYKKYNN